MFVFSFCHAEFLGWIPKDSLYKTTCAVYLSGSAALILAPLLASSASGGSLRKDERCGCGNLNEILVGGFYIEQNDSR